MLRRPVCLTNNLQRRSQYAIAGAATFTSHASHGGPVDLAFDVVKPQNGNMDNPLVILHGLFGSRRNWHSLSKAFHRNLGRPIYALDLRNHGSSPHARPMTYSAMAKDVVHFCEQHSLNGISLLGHSMGGKVAMAVALCPELPKNLLSSLIVADIGPAKGKLSKEFVHYIEGMQEVEHRRLHSRKEAGSVMEHYEKDLMTRSFLLTNVVTPARPSDPIRFRVPLNIIRDSIDEIGSFPYEPGDASWNGPTLFVKGSKSHYLNTRNIEYAKQFFPQMKLETLDAGHWLHAERSNEFAKLVTQFIA